MSEQVHIDENGVEFFDGYKVERNAVTLWEVPMCRVSWEGCAHLEGYEKPGLLLPNNYGLHEIRNSVFQFMLGIGVGLKLGKIEKQNEMLKVLGLRVENVNGAS